MNYYYASMAQGVAVFVLSMIALITWDIRRQIRAEARLTRRSTPKFHLKPYTHKEHNYDL